ncbi:unnamed protein product [Closterium sp. NIES-53]
MDSGGVGAGGAATAGPRSEGARLRGVGVGGAGTRGANSGGAGARGASAGGASSGGTGAGCAGTGGASSRGAGAGGAGAGGTGGAGGASSGGTEAGGTSAGGASSGGAGAGGARSVGASTKETAAGGTSTAPPTAPPHHYDTRLQALCRLEREEQERLEEERKELQQLDQQQQQQQPQQLQPPLLHPRCTLPVSVLPSPPELSLIVSSHPITDYYRAAHPVDSRVLASLVTDPRASPFSVSALTTNVVDFASTRCLYYTMRVVAAPPPRLLSAGGESALGCDVLQDRQFELEFLTTAPSSLCAMLLSPEGDPDALDILTPRTNQLASWRSTRTYVDDVPPPKANVVDGMWLFKVKRLPGSPLVFNACYVARGFSHREVVDFFQTFALTPKMTTLWVLLDVAAQRDDELHSLDFSIAFLHGCLHEEIWLQCPPGFTDTFPPGTQLNLRRPVYGLRQSPCEYHDTLRSTLRDLGFRPSSADPSLIVRVGSTHFFILVYIDDLVFATADRAALAEVKSELQKRHTCTDLGELQRFLGPQITRDRAARTITLTQSHMVQQVLRWFGFQFSTTQPTPLAVDHRLTGPFPDKHFESSGPYAERVGCLSLGAGALSWRSTQLSSVASSCSEAEIYAGAMAAHELHWLTFLLTNLGELPRSAPTLYADKKSMILLCREPRLESRVKHIDVRYFLLRELQRRGQARLDFVASEANTADVFTKALAPGDHHRFCVQLGLVEVGPRLL